MGKPKLRWLQSVEERLNNMGVENWRRKLQDGEQWRTILEEAKSVKDCNARIRSSEFGD